MVSFYIYNMKKINESSRDVLMSYSRFVNQQRTEKEQKMAEIMEENSRIGLYPFLDKIDRHFTK